MEKERELQSLADIRRTKRTLQEQISKLINEFEKDREIKVIKVCYELEQEEGKLPELEIYPIKPEEIHIKLEDIWINQRNVIKKQIKGGGEINGKKYRRT